MKYVTITNNEYQELKRKEQKLELIQELIENNPERYYKLFSILEKNNNIFWLNPP